MASNPDHSDRQRPQTSRAKRPRIDDENALKALQAILVDNLNRIPNAATRENVRVTIGIIVYSSIRKAIRKLPITSEFSSSEEGSDTEGSGGEEGQKEETHIKMFARLMIRELRRIKDINDRRHARDVVQHFLSGCIMIATGKSGTVENMTAAEINEYAGQQLEKFLNEVSASESTAMPPPNQ